MFFFMTTVRHPKNAKNYQTVIDLLSKTIESVCSQQTGYPFKFVVVCNEVPKINVDESKVIFHVVDFPSPGSGKANQLAFDSFLIDKGTKLASGLLFIEKFSPSKIFIIDADDWVSNNVVDYVSTHSDKDFWYANSGYLLDLANKKSVRKFGLCRYCGSTFIYDYAKLMKMLNMDKKLTFSSSQEKVISGIDQFSLLNILGNHRNQFSYIRKFGYELTELPFKSICWVVNTSENHSGSEGSHYGMPVRKPLLLQFGISSINDSCESVSISDYVNEKIDMYRSYLGWTTTNKNLTQV